MGGFENTAPADVYKRWCQFGILSSHSRLHGSGSYRVPWMFDEEACDVMRKFVKMKCALMPYLYRQAVLAHQEGVPMMRPVFLEFPDDRACEPLERQYMFGDSLLVAPVFKESGEVEYYVPKGRWLNLLTGNTVEGGTWQKETHDYFSLPLLVRPGSILAVGSEVNRPDYAYYEDVTLFLYLPQDNSRAQTCVTDTTGHTVMQVDAQRAGDEIRVHVDSEKGSWKLKVLGEENLRMVEV